MVNNSLEDFKKVRSTNKSRYVVYSLVLIIFMGVVFYLLYDDAKDKLVASERGKLEDVTSDMSMQIDSLEAIINLMIAENEALIDKIETQNKVIKEIQSRPNSPVSPSSSGLNVINVNDAKQKQEVLKDRYTKRVSVPSNYTYAVLLSNPKQSTDIRSTLSKNIPNATPSQVKEINFTPFYKSDYEIYYANDADLKIASKMQSDLRKNKKNAVIYKVKSTTRNNDVVLVH